MVTDAIAELLLRYELGDFEPRVRTRLEEIFRNAPDDAPARLARAAEYLNLDGVTEATLSRADSSSSRSRTATSENTPTLKRKDART